MWALIGYAHMSLSEGGERPVTRQEREVSLYGWKACLCLWLANSAFVYQFMSQFVDLFVQGDGKASHILEEELKSMSAISSRYPSLAKTPFYNE